MRHGLLLALGAMLLVGLLLGAIALVRGGSERVMRDRVRGLGTAPEATGPALPSIRVETAAPSALSAALCRLVRYQRDLPQAEVIAWPLVALLALGAAGLAAWGLSELLGRLPALLSAPLAGLMTARTIFAWQHARYADEMFRQMPDALGLLSRSIRAGLPLSEALRSISREMLSPTREEFARVMGEVAIGRPVDSALARLHERTGLREYAFLAVTLSLQAQTGGSLAETLDSLAELVRQRVRMSKRARALAGEAKAQAALLVVLPFLAAAAMAVIQPFYVATFTENPAGRRMALTGLGLMLLGLLTIRTLIRQAGQD